MRRYAVFLVLLLSLCSFALAHPGGTDSSGGHMDHSTGEYHYHHGYSAHSHDGGVCPYDYDNKTGENSGYSSGSGSGSSSATYYRSTDNVNMRSSASSSSSILQTVPEGATLKYLGSRSGNWYKVSYGGISGWVYGDYIVKRVSSSSVSNSISRPTASPTIRPTATPKPSQSSRKELVPMTFKNILIFIGIGFALGLVILIIYSNKVSDREDKMRKEAYEQSGKSFASGRQAALDSLNGFKEQLDKWQKELSANEFNFRQKEALFLEEATRLKNELPPMESIVNVKIAESYYSRSLYHRTDSTCLKYGKIVTMQTAQELYLRPCKICKPNEQAFITLPEATAKSKWNIVSLDKYLEKKKQEDEKRYSQMN